MRSELVANDIHGVPCKDCTAHSGVATSSESAQHEIKCLRKRFDEIDGAGDKAHGVLHRRIDEVVKSKLSIKFFMSIIGAILGAMIIVSGFLWNSIKTSEAAAQVFHKEIGEQMTDISVDVRVIKSELKK